MYIIIIISITKLNFGPAGMVSGNCKPVGQMVQHTSHSAQFPQAKAMCTTSPSQGKEAHFFGMHIFSG